MQNNTTREIPLSKGLVAVVDAADYEWLSQWKWTIKTCGNGKSYIKRYAQRSAGKGKLMMHRAIMNAPAGIDVDHKNGDGLDNRRANLRLATRSQNQHNSLLRSHNTSGFKGVSFKKDARRWQAAARLRGHVSHLGYFDRPEDAARAYDKFAKEHYGEFARLNFQD